VAGQVGARGEAEGERLRVGVAFQHRAQVERLEEGLLDDPVGRVDQLGAGHLDRPDDDHAAGLRERLHRARGDRVDAVVGEAQVAGLHHAADRVERELVREVAPLDVVEGGGDRAGDRIALQAGVLERLAGGAVEQLGV